jgi:hypothetical protein
MRAPCRLMPSKHCHVKSLNSCGLTRRYPRTAGVHRLAAGRRLPTVYAAGLELQVLRQLSRLDAGAAYVLVSERGSPLTARSIGHMARSAGEAGGPPLPIHHQMLPHGLVK